MAPSPCPDDSPLRVTFLSLRMSINILKVLRSDQLQRAFLLVNSLFSISPDVHY